MSILAAMGEFFGKFGVVGLGLNSCIESFFLVPPPDLLLIAMNLKTPNMALYYALICTITSAIGGAIGYGIGIWLGRPAFDWMFSLLQKKGSNKAKEYFDKTEALYNKYGSWAVFFAAFTPIPYKVFTLASGILKMNFITFIIASFIGRGMRFFIVSIVLMLFGEKIKNNIEIVIVLTTLVIIAFFAILYKKRKSLVK